MKLFPNLSKVPIRFSLIVILASPLAYYLLAIRPVNAYGTIFDEIGKAMAQSSSSSPLPPPPPLPVPEAPPVGRYEQSQPQSVRCLPQITARAPEPTPVQRVNRRPTGSYWDKNTFPQSYEAKVLLNVAPGTTRKSIANKLGDMGKYWSKFAVYETADGTIQIEFDPKPRLLDDTVKSVRIVR